MTFNDLLEEVKKYIKDEDEIKVITDAYNYALKCHKGKKRKNGDDYIVHPLTVASIVTGIDPDYETIAASLLHETINHGGSSFEELLDLFSDNIANLVNTISKINKLELPDDKKSSALHLRKVLVGITEDVRVLFIKLADRLHNMRTIYALTDSEIKEKVNETYEVLIPIARRLGINSIKSELEDLCLKYSKPDIYNEICEKLNNESNVLNNELEIMKQSISDMLTEHGISFVIKGRVKSVHSIYEKMVNGHKWDEIYDVLALRVITQDVSDCYLAIGLIHAKYRPFPNRFKDYIAMPKANMYQSLHTTIWGVDGYIFEVQIRTHEMDLVAEKGIAAHWAYKEHSDVKHNVMEQKLELFRSLIEQNNETSSDVDFETGVNSEILSTMIYCYTPKGDVVELPIGSTPIDFAYRIHSKVGDTTVGCLVNDKIQPLNSSLSDGDVVNIKTLATSTPSLEWLDFVKTTQAKNKIKSYFSKIDKENYISRGKDILEKELRRRKLSFNDVLSDDNINKICKDLKLVDLNDIYLSIGSLRYTANYIINLTIDDKKDVKDILLSKISSNKNVSLENRSDIVVDGIDNIKVSLAKCCKPIKGDPIVGYITMGQGITIHNKNCPNISNINDRVINVSWNNHSDNIYYTDIKVTVINGKNHLVDIISLAALKNIYVEKVNTFDDDIETNYYLTLKIKDNNDLDKFINSLEKEQYIKKVGRTFK